MKQADAIAARKALRIADYEAKSAEWLAKGHAHIEAGNDVRARRAYDRAQYWTAKANAVRETRS